MAALTEKALGKLLRIRGAAERAGVGTTTIKQALANREMPFRKFGASRRAPVLIAEADLVAWIEKRTTYFPSADDVARERGE
jgi:excisionase family DNA binding protein